MYTLFNILEQTKLMCIPIETIRAIIYLSASHNIILDKIMCKYFFLWRANTFFYSVSKARTYTQYDKTRHIPMRHEGGSFRFATFP